MIHDLKSMKQLKGPCTKWGEKRNETMTRKGSLELSTLARRNPDSSVNLSEVEIISLCSFARAQTDKVAKEHKKL